MQDLVYIGSVPHEEDCEQLGERYDRSKARKECRAFINQLRRTFGQEPEGASLEIKSERHDFGTYYEAVCYFEHDKPESVEYAFRCEGEMPANWDVQANIELQPAASMMNGFTIGAVLADKATR